jgi:hypothetical protein
MMALQWGSPRDPAVAAAATVPPATSLASVVDKGATPGAQGVVPAPTRVAGQAIDAKPSATVTVPAATIASSNAAIGDAPAANAAPVARIIAAPVANVAAVAPPPSAATVAPRGAATPPPPSWFVEDDPATFDATGSASPSPAVGPGTAAPSADGGARLAAANGKRMVVTSDVDVRTGPDAKFVSLGILKAGSQVAVGDCNLWCEVTVNGGSGWVFYTFLADPAAAPPAR